MYIHKAYSMIFGTKSSTETKFSQLCTAAVLASPFFLEGGVELSEWEASYQEKFCQPHVHIQFLS